MRSTPKTLERVWVTVPEHALEAWEAAFESACDTVGFFRDHATGDWQVEGIREVGTDETTLTAATALAQAISGVSAPIQRELLEQEGWVERSYAAFPEQLIGRRFAVRGSHIEKPSASGRMTLLLDAGMAFGSGEHGSTRGCLIALERIASRRPKRVLDLGTGSGILAIAAARMLRRRVLATDIEPWSVRLARRNARLNGVGHLVTARLADGWQNPALQRGAPYDLVFANILARPLALMAKDLAIHVAARGVVILSGLLFTQVQAVMVAHRQCGLRLLFRVDQHPWTTLVIGRP